MGGFDRTRSFRLGLGMISRGEVGLILATVGINNGLMDPDLFSVIVGMVLVTTLITPPMLRLLHTKPKPPVDMAVQGSQEAG